MRHAARPGTPRAWGLIACGLALGAGAASMARADEPVRLSDWLLRQPPRAEADPLALSWRAAVDVPVQVSRKKALVQALQPTAPDLAAFIDALPATGRVPVKQADARWLQANPQEDPVLRPGDSVLLPRRSEWVAVLTPGGFVCLVSFQPGAATESYLRPCGQYDQRETAWLVQPDGQVMQQGLQRWNEQAQVAPAPGAWLWAPARGSRITPAASQQLAEFLATQGQAPGAAEKTVIERHDLEHPRAAASLRDLPVTVNDWGVYGLWQTPTARLGSTGQATFTYFRADPYANITMQLQPFDWLSGAFRYTDVMYKAYGAYALSGNQSYKDKSVDLKLRLWQESPWLPQVALGWRDLLGTGLFSGEYVVASKRHGDFDFSLGMGWGYVGRRGDISNPLGKLSERFNTRPTSSNPTGGKFNVKAYFRGPAALFGGVQYHTPWDGLIVKAEVEGNDYKHEPFGKDLKARSPFNVGMVWRYRPWLDLSVAWERGDTLGFGLSAHADLDGLHTPKFLDPAPIAVAARRPAAAGNPVATARDIERQTGLTVKAIEQHDGRYTAVADNPAIGYAAPVVDRTLAVLHRDAPPEADRIGLRLEQRGTQLAEVEVDRDRWAQDKTERLPESLKPAAPSFQTPQPPAQAPAYQTERNPFSWNLGLHYSQLLGGPDAFLLYQVSASASAEWRPRDDTWLAGTYALRLIDNYDRFKYTAPSTLPRVRTYVREYVTTSRTTVPNLQLTHMGQLGSNHFYMAYGGLLESAFAGVGGEYLYRPVGSRVALGVDVNRVQQRGFDQKFDMRDYRVSTGHLTAYWDTGFQGLLVSSSVGRYLAADRGVTLDLSKVFHNGVTIGAYATKTNVSAAQFGEGSFDKGVYLHVPFDAMLPRSGASSAMVLYAPLIRDGGAKLGRRYQLYDLTGLRSRNAMTVGQ